MTSYAIASMGGNRKGNQMPVSKKDIARVLLGEKRHRDFKVKMQTPASNPRDKDGNLKQVRLRGVIFGRPDDQFPPEKIDREQAIRSGGVVPDVSVRSADGKFGAMHREYSGQIMQGRVQVSTIDGHVYGSVQKVGRTLEEAARDEGCGQLGAVIGKGKGYEPKALPESRGNASPFKRRWKSSTFEVVKK